MPTYRIQDGRGNGVVTRDIARAALELYEVDEIRLDRQKLDNPNCGLSRYPGFMATTAPPRSVPDLSFLLAHTSHVLTTRTTAALAEIGLTPRALCVLMHAEPGELTQIELASVVDLDKTTMVVTVDELEEAGYAQRVPAPADRRARLVTVTDAGRQIVAAGRLILDRVHGEVLDALPPATRPSFVDALTALAGGVLGSPVDCERPVRRVRQPSR